MDIQFFSNQFESTPVLSSHRLSCIHSYSTLIHSFLELLSFHSSSCDLFISFFYHFTFSLGSDNINIMHILCYSLEVTYVAMVKYLYLEVIVLLCTYNFIRYLLTIVIVLNKHERYCGICDLYYK